MAETSGTRRKTYAARRARLGEQLAAVELDLAKAPREIDRLRLEKEAEDLLQQIEEIEAKLDECDSEATVPNVRNCNLDQALQRLDFTEAKKIAEMLKQQFDLTGGAVLFFLQKTRLQMGHYCVQEVLNIMMREQIIGDEIVGALTYSVGLDPTPSHCNEVEFLEQLASYFNLKNGSDLETLSRQLRIKIHGLIELGTTIFIEVKGLDDLLEKEEFLKWFINSFWEPLVAQVEPASKQYKSKLIVALTADGPIPSVCSPDHFCDCQQFDSYKMLELPLPDWTAQDIHDWLIRFRAWSNQLSTQDNSNLLATATRIHRVNAGIPQNICTNLRELFL